MKCMLIIKGSSVSFSQRSYLMVFIYFKNQNQQVDYLFPYVISFNITRLEHSQGLSKIVLDTKQRQ